MKPIRSGQDVKLRRVVAYPTKIQATTFFAGRIDPVEYVGVSQQRNGNVRNRNHPLCGCATLVIQKTPFHYNRGVQATI